jgi:TonB-dependent SusC/RagA subfamily outer membrane receptor
MPVLLLYILKLSCSLCIVWLFYRLLLHNLTFYNSNRWYLLGYALLSFLIPFINIGPIDREDPALQPLIIQYIPVIGEGQPAKVSTSHVHSPAWNWPDTVLLLIALGAAFLLIRLAIRFFSLRRMRQQAELLENGRIKIYSVRDNISPFSFGNAIYINTSQHTQKEQEEIILHEYAHIRQHHTVDILAAEIITILNWYNPFAWLIRYSIRQNLEFIADRKVVENGFDKKDYQYHLLKVVGQAQYRLANNFNFSSLKKRIAMMNKLKTARLHLVKFLFILPLLAVLLVAFRNRYTGIFHHQNGAPVVNVAGIVLHKDTVEKYGYPDGPTVAGSGYLARWATISTQAEKAFHTTSTDVKAIVFPGDSRVPAGYHYPTPAVRANLLPQDVPAKLSPASQPPARTDTLPKKPDTTKGSTTTANADITRFFDTASAVIVVDGIIMPKGWKPSFGPDEIASIDVLKGKEATLLFGDKGANGVIAIATKNHTGPGSIVVHGPGGVRAFNGDFVLPPNTIIHLNNPNARDPLYVIDGVPASGNSMDLLNPDDIASIQIIKDQAGKAVYGDKASDGVVFITTKKAHPRVVMHANGNFTESGNVTIIADSIKTPQGTIPAQNPPPKP